MVTNDAARLRKVEAELAAEREKRRLAEQRIGGLQSLNTRLRAAVLMARAETAKLKAENGEDRIRSVPAAS